MDLIRQHFLDLFSLPIFPPPPPGPGAHLPPEIFEIILYHASRNGIVVLRDYRRYMQEIQEGRRKPDQEYLRRTLLPSSPRRILGNCALVSRYWANQSRRLMFDHATLTIRSLEDAQAFRHYALHGSTKLVKICDLIDKISVNQDYNEPRSLLDLVFLSATRNKLFKLQIKGPVPQRIPPSHLDTPHWYLADSTMTSQPSVTAYDSITLENLHVPSYAHFTKYISHFRSAKTLFFDSLTWDGKFSPGDWRVRVKPSPRSPLHTTFTATECTSNYLVCLQAVMWYPNFPLHAAL